MVLTGIIGGSVGYHLLRQIARHVAKDHHCSGTAYEGRSKLEALFGTQIRTEVAGKVVVDFGCGFGKEAVEVAQRGPKKVIAIDIRHSVLEVARSMAEKAGVSDRCVFTTHTDETADVILSIDGFEHYDDPEAVLQIMRHIIRPCGRVFVAFGPTWFHPYGGHLFSIFPWAHLIFTEKALIRWRSDFKSDGATRFSEVAGGLNQMTINRFRKVLDNSDFLIESLEAVPIKKLRYCIIA